MSSRWFEKFGQYLLFQLRVAMPRGYTGIDLCNSRKPQPGIKVRILLSTTEFVLSLELTYVYSLRISKEYIALMDEIGKSKQRSASPSALRVSSHMNDQSEPL